MVAHKVPERVQAHVGSRREKFLEEGCGFLVVAVTEQVGVREARQDGVVGVADDAYDKLLVFFTLGGRTNKKEKQSLQSKEGIPLSRPSVVIRVL